MKECNQILQAQIDSIEQPTTRSTNPVEQGEKMSDPTNTPNRRPVIASSPPPTAEAHDSSSLPPPPPEMEEDNEEDQDQWSADEALFILRNQTRAALTSAETAYNASMEVTTTAARTKQAETRAKAAADNAGQAETRANTAADNAERREKATKVVVASAEKLVRHSAVVLFTSTFLGLALGWLVFVFFLNDRDEATAPPVEQTDEELTNGGEATADESVEPEATATPEVVPAPTPEVWICDRPGTKVGYVAGSEAEGFIKISCDQVWRCNWKAELAASDCVEQTAGS